jgi:hypothetical protein
MLNSNNKKINRNINYCSVLSLSTESWLLRTAVHPFEFLRILLGQIHLSWCQILLPGGNKRQGVQKARLLRIICRRKDALMQCLASQIMGICIN